MGGKDRTWGWPNIHRRLRPDTRARREAVVRGNRIGGWKAVVRPAGERWKPLVWMTTGVGEAIFDHGRERDAKAGVHWTSTEGGKVAGVLDAEVEVGVGWAFESGEGVAGT